MGGEARAEVEDIHRFFVDWFGGRCENSDAVFAKRLTRRLAPGFALIQPDGTLLERGALLGMLRHSFGRDPELEIEIREVDSREIAADTLLVSYQEWHTRSVFSSRAAAGRLSSAVMRRDPELPGGLLWLHLHETWLVNSPPAP
jgi:hypothetical protein